MNKLKLTTLTLSVLLLTACGGGGSSDKTDSESDSGTAAETTTSTPANLSGKYTVVVTPSSSAGNDCGGAVGSYDLASNGDITGTVTDSSGTVFTVSGDRETNGDVTGGFAFSNGQKSADFTGTIDDNAARGIWNDIYGCSGNWVATKQ